jgi:hypothetical protein
MDEWKAGFAYIVNSTLSLVGNDRFRYVSELAGLSLGPN